MNVSDPMKPSADGPSPSDGLPNYSVEDAMDAGANEQIAPSNNGDQLDRLDLVNNPKIDTVHSANASVGENPSDVSRNSSVDSTSYNPEVSLVHSAHHSSVCSAHPSDAVDNSEVNTVSSDVRSVCQNRSDDTSRMDPVVFRWSLFSNAQPPDEGLRQPPPVQPKTKVVIAIPCSYPTYVVPHYATPPNIVQRRSTSYPPLMPTTSYPPLMPTTSYPASSMSTPYPASLMLTTSYSASLMSTMPTTSYPPLRIGDRDVGSRKCSFCLKNGEPFKQYVSHFLRHPVTSQLVCPVLRKHVCEECGATGDDGHTRSHCPRLQPRPRQPVTVAVNRTRRQGDGSLRIWRN